MSSVQAPGRWQVWRSSDVPRDWWPRWDALNQSGTGGVPILDSRFARAALDHFGGAEVFAEFGSGDDTRLMLVVRRVSRLRWSIFQPSQAPLPLLVQRSHTPSGPTLLQRLLRELSLLSVALDLPCVDPRHALWQFQQADPVLDSKFYGTTMSVTGDAGFEAYWETRPKGLRQNIGRYFRRLEREGLPWRLDIVTHPGAMADAVRQYGVLESAGWKGEAGSAVHPENEQGRFYRDVLQAFAGTADAFVYQLHVGDRLVASRLTVRGQGTVVMLKTAFDESMAQYAPGRLMTYLALQDMLGDPRVRRVEFYTKANRDALEWASEQRDLFVSTIFRDALMLRAVRVRRAARARRAS